MPITENSNLLFSSCHLDLVISENSQFFPCNFEKITSKKSTIFQKIISR